MSEHSTELAKGTFGSLAVILGVAVSSLAQIEQWLRVASLIIGCGVGLATMWAILRKKS